MAISAQRFRFLDNETNLPIKDFIKLSDNAVYNIQDLIETSLTQIFNNSEIMNALLGGISEFMSLLENDDMLNAIKDTLNSVIDSLFSMDLPVIVKDVLGFLKNLDIEGTKDFFREALKIGSAALCNDFLKYFILGSAVSPNIMAGLILALLLSWLDRFCNGVNKDEREYMSNEEIVHTMFPSKALTVDSGSVFSEFTSLYSDFNKFSAPFNLATPMSTNDFLNNVLSGNIESALLNLRNSEISYSDRDNYLSVLESNLSSYPPSSSEFKNILKARGELLNMPLISTERIDRNIKYSNLSDKLGSYLKQLPDIKINDLDANTMSDVEKSLFNKMKELKTSVSHNATILSTEERSFDNFDFSSVLPPLTAQEQTFINNLDYESESFRDGDIHTTTSVFLQYA